MCVEVGDVIDENEVIVYYILIANIHMAYISMCVGTIYIIKESYYAHST